MTLKLCRRLNRVSNKSESNAEHRRCFLSDFLNFLPYAITQPEAGWLRGKQFGNPDQVVGDQIE
jgi:hypothetical protein